MHLVGAMCCLGFSATFHLLKDHSKSVGEKLARLDYAGISLLIAGSNMPPIYYSFYC
jgi:adiponectin receptor